MGNDILWFNEVSLKDISLVGGKAANLGEMISHFPIPNGFYITESQTKHKLANKWQARNASGSTAR